MQGQNKQIKKAILLGIITFLLVVIVVVIISFVRSTNPRTQAKKEAIQIAEEYAQLTTVDEFYWFSRNETYFTIAGKNDNAEELFVVIPKSGGNVTVLNQADGTTEDQIRQIVQTDYNETSIRKVNLGIFEEQPVWEVVTNGQNNSLNYYLLSFKNAEEISVIKDI